MQKIENIPSVETKNEIIKIDTNAILRYFGSNLTKWMVEDALKKIKK